VGIFGRGYWTPDEPREADIAWRMSWQSDKAVPLLAGEAFCEKPPLTYWIAGAAIRAFGPSAWAARLPNLLYALITSLGVGLLARRCLGTYAGLAAAAAIGTFLLSYQVGIWLATDAPLLAAVSVALLGAYGGFYAERSSDRLRSYTLMHAALALGFLSKSAVAWMVPALAIPTLAIWERRWRELLRWELYAGLLLQALVILAWVWFVYAGPDGAAHLKVFFWNNLAGRFAQVDAPQELQYAAGHKNTLGKYFLELPAYLWPWTLLVAAALRRAWLERRAAPDELRPVRFALASALPALALLSVAATARNVYLAPALPGFALLVAWWARETLRVHDRWDLRAMRGTALLLLIGVAAFAAASWVVGMDAWNRGSAGAADSSGFGLSGFIGICGLGLIAAAILAIRADLAARGRNMARAQLALVLAYCVLLTAPASQLYRQVDTWQNLAAIGRAIQTDAAGRPLVLLAPDETTRALIDMYARTDVGLIRGPIDAAATERLEERLAREPRSLVVTQLPGRAALGVSGVEREPQWLSAPWLRIAHRYALPHGRRYALLEASGVRDP
jgi:4-amino-4-deoxy-L-arabinose transferase-like glycosyltransferase